jgi:hypothetical protein
MTDNRPAASGRPLLLRIGIGHLLAGFLLLPLLASTLAAGRAEGATPSRFTAVNRSPYVIKAVYATQPRSPQWGPDLLKGRPLPPRHQIALDLPGGCGVYDLRFVADDGIEFLEDGVRFCKSDEEGAEAVVEESRELEDVITLGGNDLKRTRRPRVVPAGSAEVRR